MSTFVRPRTLPEAFSRFSSNSLLVLSDGSRISYGEFWDLAECKALRLGEMGAKPGDSVVVRLENSHHLLNLYLACALAGLVVCPLDPAMPPARVALVERLLKPVLVIDQGTLAELDKVPAAASVLPAFDDTRDFLIVYSSGTTSEPKGIVHSVASLSASARSFATLSELNEGSVVYHHFPMFYMAGIFNMFFCPMMAGATIVVGPKFSNMQMLRFWEIPKAHGVNHLTLTPTMALSLTQVYRSDDALLEQLARYEAVISTGSSLYPSVAHRFQKTFGVPLRSCYGVTEIGGSITLQSWAEALEQDSVGGLRPEIAVKGGTDASNPSEILVKTPFMMKGYRTEGGMVSPFDADGYFHTGDLGYVRDHVLYLTGRENDLVKKGGEFVSLLMIENLALTCPLLADAAAVAVPDEYWGNRVVLFYTPAAGADVDAVDVQLAAILGDGLRKIEQPDKVIPVPKMPKTSIGKTIKRDLLARYTL